MFLDDKLKLPLTTKLSPAYVITHTTLHFEPILGGGHQNQCMELYFICEEMSLQFLI